MNYKRLLKLTLALLVGIYGLLDAKRCQASPIAFHVSVTTEPFIGNPLGPFVLDFEITSIGGLANSAIISNFNFEGGSAIDPPLFVTQNAGGSLSSTVTLALSSSVTSNISAFGQRFTPGNNLDFDVLLIPNSDTAHNAAGFFIQFFDKDFAVVPGARVNVPLGVVASDIRTANGTGSFSGVVVVASAPEPSSMLSLGFGLSFLAVVATCRKPQLRMTESVSIETTGG